jgi:hypothetical protein
MGLDPKRKKKELEIEEEKTTRARRKSMRRNPDLFCPCTDASSPCRRQNPRIAHAAVMSSRAALPDLFRASSQAVACTTTPSLPSLAAPPLLQQRKKNKGEEKRG